jgi:hypothetical protein
VPVGVVGAMSLPLGVTVIVVGVPGMVVGGAEAVTGALGVPGAHCPVAQLDVLGFEQQVELQPIDPKTIRPATPAASRTFVISRSFVVCPAGAMSRRFHTFGFRSARSRGVFRVYRLFGRSTPANFRACNGYAPVTRHPPPITS